MKAELILYNIEELVTSREIIEKKDSSNMENIELLKNGYLAINKGKIIEIGSGSYPEALVDKNTKMVDLKNKTVIPGIVDSHTHLVHGGSRENELTMKIKGVPYLEILKSGGGILSTVIATRKATEKELVEKSLKILDRMAEYGVTTVESKSGYGLDLETELKQLEVNKIINETHSLDVVSTFMGAHAIPTEFKGNKEGYIQELMKMMEVVKEKKLAEFCDIFCEDAVFTVEDSRRILMAAKDKGFKLKIHADEIVSLGGAELGAELGCVSADHLMAISDLGIQKLKEKKIIANILPSTSFNLGKTYAPVRKMIDEGVEIAISSDYNPGSSPCENIGIAMAISCCGIRMTPLEIIKAVTINGAKSLCLEDKIGSLEVGKDADFVIFDKPNLEYIFYNFGVNNVEEVYKRGIKIVENGRKI